MTRDAKRKRDTGMAKRSATEHRKTRETDITLTLDVDGTGRADIATGVPFFDHMLELLTRHALFDLTVKAHGDLEVDYHHTLEDVGLVLGTVLDRALGTRRGIARYGSCLLPMDDALARVAVDLGGRPFLVYRIANRKKRIRDFDVQLVEEFFRAFVVQGRLNLHIDQEYGKDVHHAYEAVFKGVARALRAACAIDPREPGIPSSKGVV